MKTKLICTLFALLLPWLAYGENTNLLGNWGGFRDWLKCRGITPIVHYWNDPLGNPIGGKSQGMTQIGEIKFLLDGDLGCGRGYHISGMWKSGNNLSGKYIGNAFNVAELYGGRTWRLASLHLQYSFCQDKYFVKAGRLAAGEDFMTSPLYFYYVNTAFDHNPIAVFFNFPAFTTFPEDTWGVMGKAYLTPSWLTKIGLYNANSHIFENRYNGMNFTFKSTDGVQILTETTYLKKGDFPGNYQIGILFQTGKSTKFLGGNVQGNYSLYTYFDQVMPFNKKLTAFACGMIAPKNRNKFPYYFQTGLLYQGLIPSRRKDMSAIGLAYGSYSSDLRKTQGKKTQNFEMVIEMNHRFTFCGWGYFSPDLQVVIKPKGFSSTPNALVLGGELGIDI